MGIIDTVEECDHWIQYYLEEINNLKLLKLELIQKEKERNAD